MKNPEGYDFKRVRTADILEFPTALGQGCCILGEYGLASALVKHTTPHQPSRPLLLSNMETLYRTGCWRRYHEPSMTTRCI